MVTRIYCDHCGHAAPNAQKYIFGSQNHFYGTEIVDSTNQHAIHSIKSQGGLSPVAQQPPAPKIDKIGSVDLCDHCQIIWMNRVKALTQASEP